MRFAPTPIFLLASIALVTATRVRPGPVMPDPWPVGLDPKDPQTLFAHVQGVYQHEARVRFLQSYAGDEKRAKEIPKLKVERDRHVNARDKSAKAIAELKIPIHHPSSNISSQARANYYSNSIRSDKADFDDEVQNVKAERQFLQSKHADRRNLAQFNMAQLMAQVDVRRARIANHTTSLANLQLQSPEITLDRDIVAHMDSQRPHPSLFRSRILPLPPPSSPPHPPPSSSPHGGGNQYQFIPYDPPQSTGQSVGSRRRRSPPPISQRHGSPVTASVVDLPEYADPNRRLDGESQSGVPRAPRLPILLSSSSPSQYGVGVVGDQSPSSAPLSNPSSSQDGMRRMGISSEVTERERKRQKKLW